MTEKALQSRVLKARERIKSGKFTSQEDLEKEVIELKKVWEEL